MKKTLVTILVLSLIVALSACGELATIQQNPTKPTTAATQPNEKLVEQKNQTVSKEQAIELALQEAGASKETATNVEAELDQEQTEIVWEVEFEIQGKEYSYDVHADNGTVEETEAEEKQPAVQETAPATQPVAPETTPETQPATKQTITRERAIEIALQDAGLTKEAVTDLEAELDKERNGLFWEVSFETREKEYDYEIHAYDGTVAKVETEKEDHRPAVTPKQPETTPEIQPVTEPTVSKEQAIEIALQAAGLTREAVADLEAELDKERDGLFWEVSFETREKEYDFDINANDGAVTKVETEKENEKPVATEPVEPAVTKEQAIEIALQAAGLTKAEVTDLEAELDKERGVPVWEVSFETRQKEYSYEINANDGEIVKAESERND